MENDNGAGNGTQPDSGVENIAGQSVRVTYNKKGERVNIERPDLQGTALTDWEAKAENALKLEASSHKRNYDARLIQQENESEKVRLKNWESDLKRKQEEIQNKLLGKDNVPETFEKYLQDNASNFDGISDVEELLEEAPAKYHKAYDTYSNLKLDASLKAVRDSVRPTQGSVVNQQILNDPDIDVEPAVLEKWAEERNFPFNAYAIQAYKALHTKAIDPTVQINNIEKKRNSTVTFVDRGDFSSKNSFTPLTERQVRELSPAALKEYEAKLTAMLT